MVITRHILAGAPQSLQTWYVESYIPWFDKVLFP